MSSIIKLKDLVEELANMAGSVGKSYSTVSVEMGTHDCKEIDKNYHTKIRLYIDGFGATENKDPEKALEEMRCRIYGTAGREIVGDVEIEL